MYKFLLLIVTMWCQTGWAGSAPNIPEAMQICGTSLSPARQQVVAQQIARISAVYFRSPEHADAFLGLLCIESKFDQSQHSKSGAVGMAQLMPKYAAFFGEECGLPGVTAADLEDSEVNLTLGACHFRQLLDALDGNVALALSGYNSGQSSETTKKLSKLITNTRSQTETLGYVSKFYVYINRLQHAENK